MPGGGGAKGGTDNVRSFVTFLHCWLPLAKCIYLRVRPCICYTSFVILLNHSMLNLQSFAFNFLQRPNLYQRDWILWKKFHCCVEDLILITRMFWLLIVAIFIDDGHGCISLIDYQPNIPRVCHRLYPSPESGD